MNRRLTSVLTVLAATAAIAVAYPGHATAAPPAIGHASHATGEGRDNMPDPLATTWQTQRERAVDQLVRGKAHLEGTGEDRHIKTSDGSLVSYPATQKAQLLTFLVQFGTGSGNPAFPDNTAGPVHNQIQRPAASDNTTYWEPDFSPAHYKEMFFTGLPDQGGESFHDAYEQMSSGRFDIEGDVSDWVTVPHPESYYQDGSGHEPPAVMTNYVQDSANAWYDAQRAAGKSDAQIKAYLAGFDTEDRYDMNGDGNTAQPDHYIDHFQLVHAGVGEESGAAPWTIWAHRGSADMEGFGTVGPQPSVTCPACYPEGGVEIGDTGYYIRDYTTEPENGGLGVFAHEFGHDLGLPDYYDTTGADNSTAYWTLMSGGSWMNHDHGNVGTTPDEMGPNEKLFLGWYGPNNDDLAVVDGTANDPQTVTLGPSYHATTLGKEAVYVKLPNGQQTRTGPASTSIDGNYLYSGAADATTADATSPALTVPADDPIAHARVAYSIETGYDYAYLQASTDDGATWANVPTSASTESNPNGQNLGEGITGGSGWTDLTADLTAYAGQSVKLRWRYITDPATHGVGLLIDSLSLGDYSTDFEASDGWTLNGFYGVAGNRYTITYRQHYMLENRQYDGYDSTLKEGPYSPDYALSAPRKVDHFAYQDGLLVWYSNGLYRDNNTSQHPGGGQALPVDANPAALYWTGATTSPAAARLDAFDATFDVDTTDGFHLHRETADGGQTLDLPAHPSIPVFNDSDPDAYYDPATPLLSTRVSGLGAQFQVLSSDEDTGQMVVRIGHQFVADTSPATVVGHVATHRALEAVAPGWFEDGVATSYQWTRDGVAIPGATSATYTLAPGDPGTDLAVRITGSKDGYTPTTVTAVAASRGH